MSSEGKMEEIKFRTLDTYKTTILDNLKPGDKIIRTKDWGDFKLRKNGRVILSIGNEIIKVTPIKKECLSF